MGHFYGLSYTVGPDGQRGVMQLQIGARTAAHRLWVPLPLLSLSMTLLLSPFLSVCLPVCLSLWVAVHLLLIIVSICLASGNAVFFYQLVFLSASLSLSLSLCLSLSLSLSSSL